MNEKDQVMKSGNIGHLTVDEIAKFFNTDLKKGLSQSEVEKRREQFGFNELPEKEPISIVKLIVAQFSNVIIWLLMGAIGVAAFLGEWVDTIAIAAIVLLNAVIGFFQEYKAERSLEALKKLTQPIAKVIRDGKLLSIPSRELVPGDLVLVEEGDSIVADGRIIQANNILTQEAALTGESVPTEKTDRAQPGKTNEIIEKKNHLFMGTSMAKGRGKMVVTATGLQTELGKIASYLKVEAQPEMTPLQKKLNVLGVRLTWMCVAIVGIVFGAGIWRGSSFGDSLLIAISLAVAAIPEGLPAIVTVALAMGVRKMAEYKALVRHLPSVETLGCTTVICTDKTGTLTQNEMTVHQIWENQSFSNTPKDLEWPLTIGILCNNAELYQDDGRWKSRGDPTEVALLVAGQKAGLTKENLEGQYPFQKEFPFDSERKFMSTLRKNGEGSILFVKGALDVLLSLSDKIWMKDQEIPLTAQLRDEILKVNGELTNQAFRVLALAHRKLNSQTPQESDLTLVALVALFDPPRSEVKKAIELCHKAGIEIVMITGDHPNTAVAIARELNILKPDTLVVKGQELEEMSDEALNEKVRHIGIYARTSAALKLKIVRAWKSVGEIVAMTGDGINDAPAIKESNIGLSMGLNGTDVAREASDIVILDDNFATIVDAIRVGRGIYDNILKFVNYLISCNIAELLIIFASIIFDFRDASGNPFVALTAVQLLWLNLVTDGLPAIALSMDPVDPQAMERPPRKPQDPILSLRLFCHLSAISVVIAIGALIGCFYGLKKSPELAYTMTFTILVVLELVRVQMVRAQYHMKLFSNRLIIIALASSIALQLIVVYVPFLQTVFNTVSLNLQDWGVILGIGVGVFLLSTVVNSIFKKFFRE